MDKICKTVVAAIAAFFGLCIFAFVMPYYDEWASHRKYAGELERTFNERLVPAAAFIRRFVEREHRLPSEEEMQQSGWKLGCGNGGITVLTEPPSPSSDWGTVGKDFIVVTDVPDHPFTQMVSRIPLMG